MTTNKPVLMDASLNNIKHLIDNLIDGDIFIKTISMNIPKGYINQLFKILIDNNELLMRNNVQWVIKKTETEGIELIISH